MISITPYSLRDFQQYQEHAPISLKVLVFILLKIYIEMYLPFNYLYIVDLNITKPT